MKMKDVYQVKNLEWWEQVSNPVEEGRKYHASNIKRCAEAIKEYKELDRPLRILAVHGSGRSGAKSCAHEQSNSQTLLRSSLVVVKTIDPPIETEEVNLRDYMIEPCNSCYSTASPLCNFPCTCFPGDQMQLLYPKVLRSDVLLCSTGVNQATMHGRLKNFCDRLISLDGGTFIAADQFAFKDKDYKSRMQALEATGKFAYDQRLYGRVAAYFISSKDERQELPQANASGESLVDKYGYLRLTAEVLKDGFESYGYFHAEDFFAGFAPEANVQMMYDKDALNMDTEAVSHGKKVVSDAIILAKKLKKDLPPYKQDRINRT